jgi:hypothetical protein
LRTRVPALIASINELKPIREWEEELDPIQRQLPATKDKLVEWCETAILMRFEYVAFSSYKRNHKLNEMIDRQ